MLAIKLVISIAVTVLVMLTVSVHALNDESALTLSERAYAEQYMRFTLTPPPEPEPEKKLDPVKDNPNNCDLVTEYVHPDFTCTKKPAPVEPTTTKVFHSGDCNSYRSEFEKYNWNVDTAIAICNCESTGNPGAIGDTNTAYPSYGLMQIRGLPGRPPASSLIDPVFNIQYAFSMYKGQGWIPWTCYYKI